MMAVFNHKNHRKAMHIPSILNPQSSILNSDFPNARAFFPLVDSHCHLNQLDLDKYDGILQSAVDKAQENGIKTILSVGTTLTELPEILALTETLKGVDVYASAGVHPSEKVMGEPTVEKLIQFADHSKVVAIGETGLDYHYTFVDLQTQKERFRRHIQAARALKKPLIIHVRESAEDILTLLREEQASDVGGVLHCFTETWDVAKQALDLGFHFGFSGILTFQKATQVHLAATQLPLDRILLETDAPYLAPNPMRGKANEPAYLKFTAEYLAKLRNIPFEMVAEQTTINFYRLFSRLR